MNAQDIFDVVAEHLLRQNMRCMNPQTLLVQWRYKHLSCAFGILFPLDIDERVFKYATVAAVLLHYPQLEKYKPYQTLLIALQQIHDQQPALHWRRELGLCAQRFGLANTVLPKE